MKASERKRELKEKSADELRVELGALMKEQFGLRMQKATQQLQSSAKIVRVRRDIARVKTLLNEKARQA